MAAPKVADNSHTGCENVCKNKVAHKAEEFSAKRPKTTAEETSKRRTPPCLRNRRSKTREQKKQCERDFRSKEPRSF